MEAYSPLRQHITKLSLATATWDKHGPGRGKDTSETDQPVHDSAREGLDAVKPLRKRVFPGLKINAPPSMGTDLHVSSQAIEIEIKQRPCK